MYDQSHIGFFIFFNSSSVLKYCALEFISGDIFIPSILAKCLPLISRVAIPYQPHAPHLRRHQHSTHLPLFRTSSQLDESQSRRPSRSSMIELRPRAWRGPPQRSQRLQSIRLDFFIPARPIPRMRHARVSRRRGTLLRFQIPLHDPVAAFTHRPTTSSAAVSRRNVPGIVCAEKKACAPTGWLVCPVVAVVRAAQVRDQRLQILPSRRED